MGVLRETDFSKHLIKDVTNFEKCIMKVKNRFLFFFSIMGFLLMTISSPGQKVTTKDFLEEFSSNQCFTGTFDQLLEAINPEENSLNKKVKSVLNNKQPLIMVEGERAFPSPCNVHKFGLERGKYSLEFISLGNMAGFKKTIMIPCIKVYNKNGELIDNSRADKYETRSPTNTLPFHIYSLWEFKIDENDFYYIQITSDNSSDSNLILDETSEQAFISGGTTTGSPIVAGASLITTMLLKGYPVKRSPFGKYKMILKKNILEKQ